MKYLKIKNNGELDIRLVALMGGTTKQGNEYKIGQFGTGLKYTLAYLIRNNVDFHIFSGANKIDIKTEKEVIADTEFNIIRINGNRTSITDKMGHEWKAWMIVRELWCNALDEGGQQKDVTEEISGEAGTTTFYIQVTNEIQEILSEWTKYFIHDESPIFSDSQHALYNGGESLRIYKNGVLIKELPKTKSLFSYDMKYASINELREFNGSVNNVIFRCLKDIDAKTATYFLENIKDKHYEGSEGMDYNWFESFGPKWAEAVGSAKLIHKEAIKTIQDRGIDIDTEGMVEVPKKVYEFLTTQIEGCGALRVSSKMKEFYESYSSEADERVKQALVILEECGYNFSPEIKYTYGVFGDKLINAQVSLDTKEVFISEKILDMPLFDIVSILIEENEHLKTGHSDHSREFQTHLLKLYTKQLLKTSKIAL